MLMETSYLHTVVMIPFLQLVAVNPTVRIKNRVLDTHTMPVVNFVICIRPIVPVQVASCFLQQKIRLKQ